MLKPLFKGICCSLLTEPAVAAPRDVLFLLGPHVPLGFSHSMIEHIWGVRFALFVPSAEPL